jgi:hypothetical protein
MHLQTAFLPAEPGHPGLADAGAPAGWTGRVVLRHLKSGEEIADILHLRGEIDLSAHQGDSNFAELDKKEMKSGWCSASSWTASSSGRSASCPWAFS